MAVPYKHSRTLLSLFFGHAGKRILLKGIGMTNYALLIAVAAIGGIATSLQGQFMGLMDQRLGTKASVFITYASGGLVVALAVLLSGGWNLKGWQNVPWYAFSTGLLGLVIVGTISYTVPRLGLTAAFTILVASQFIIAALLDHFGLLGGAVRPLDLSRSLGIGILILGVWLIMR
jgi:transporter family-2 protein